VVRGYGVQFALGKVQLASGQTAAGRATLAALIKDAKARGVVVWVKRAEGAMK
jgi:hypothetical protein